MLGARLALLLCIPKWAQEPRWEIRNGSVREQVPRKRLSAILETCLLVLSHTSPLPAGWDCGETLKILCCELWEFRVWPWSIMITNSYWPLATCQALSWMFCVASHLVLTWALWKGSVTPFADEETKTESSYIMCPESQSSKCGSWIGYRQSGRRAQAHLCAVLGVTMCSIFWKKFWLILLFQSRYYHCLLRFGHWIM